jgi:hypothetical protein
MDIWGLNPEWFKSLWLKASFALQLKKIMESLSQGSRIVSDTNRLGRLITCSID